MRSEIQRIVFAALLCASTSFPVAAQSVIKIAVGAPLTGPLAKQGQEVANAVKLAAEEWNARGGVLGKKIEVVAADDQGNPQVGVAAAEKVAAEFSGDGNVQRMVQFVREAGKPNRVLVKELRGIRAAGELTVTLTPSAGATIREPILCGIEIVAEGW
jgi:hypothetical protein